MNIKNSIVFIVDNDKNYRHTIKDALEEIGCTVVDANDSDVALKAMETIQPNLIIMDMRLKKDNDTNDTSGIKLMRQMPHHIPVIILTAYDNGDAVRKAYEGMPEMPKPAAYLFKSDGVQAIKARVEQILEANQPSAKPWYKEKSFIVLASVTLILSIIIIGIAVYFRYEFIQIIVSIAIGIVVDIGVAILLRFIER